MFFFPIGVVYLLPILIDCFGSITNFNLIIAFYTLIIRFE